MIAKARAAVCAICNEIFDTTDFTDDTDREQTRRTKAELLGSAALASAHSETGKGRAGVGTIAIAQQSCSRDQISKSVHRPGWERRSKSQKSTAAFIYSF